MRSTSGIALAMRAEVDAVRAALQHGEREALRLGAEAVAVGADAQHEVEHTLGAAARLERLEQLGRLAAGDARAGVADLALHQRVDDEVVERLDVGVRALAGEDARQPQEDLPLGRPLRRSKTAGE